MDIKKFFEKYCKNSKKFIINMVILLLCGVLLILIGDITSSLNSDKKKSANVKNSVQVNTNAEVIATSSSYEERVKKELSETLLQIAGVGKVSVMIYFEGGSESIPAMNINDTNKKIEEKDNQGGIRTTTESNKNQNIVVVSEGGGNKPFIIKQVNPSIGGVIVVAEGADNAEIRERLHNAVKTVLNIPANRVSVMPMKKN
jgi:stage III sporulation protein AG